MALVEPPIAISTVIAFSKRLQRKNVRRLAVLPHHLDDPRAAVHRHADVIRIGRRNRRRAGQRHAERFGERGHGGRRAHRHAESGRARDAVFDVAPVLLP